MAESIKKPKAPEPASKERANQASINQESINKKSTLQPQRPHLIAIVAPTASGKSALALRLARVLDAEIFSIDSLSIYKHIDIASAKPTKAELASAHHYGIDVLSPDEHCSAGVFCALFEEAIKQCQKPFLLVVGGSGFYLDCLINGLSPMPDIAQDALSAINARIDSMPDTYAFLESIDADSARAIKPSDTYRIHKLLEIFFATQMPPSAYFRQNPTTPIIQKIDIYSIITPREELIGRIDARSREMVDSGLIDEARFLLEKYGRDIQPFKAIGLKEALAYIDMERETSGKSGEKSGKMDREKSGKMSREELATLISIHTRQLAKRQATFIRTKFASAQNLALDKIEEKILQDMEKYR